MPAVDLDATIRALATLSDELGRLVSVAVDLRASFSDRQAAALAACDLIERTGALETLRQARAWIESNRMHVDRAMRAGAFLQALRGR